MVDRSPVFDAIKALRGGRSFTAAEVPQVDDLLDRLGVSRSEAATGAKLGSLSERYESGGRGPGTVSSGAGDPGGVSYGLYQLASKTGTVAAFLAAEGKPWAAELIGSPGSDTFSNAWKGIAARQAEAFGDAQHAFIERTHYRPVVDKVLQETGLDCDALPVPCRDAVWSCAVQHGRAAEIVAGGVLRADKAATRGGADYPRAFVNGVYDSRVAYVQKLAVGPNAQTFRNILENRYPDERKRALEALK